jgi:hypothetical protein
VKLSPLKDQDEADVARRHPKGGDHEQIDDGCTVDRRVVGLPRRIRHRRQWPGSHRRRKRRMGVGRRASIDGLHGRRRVGGLLISTSAWGSLGAASSRSRAAARISRRADTAPLYRHEAEGGEVAQAWRHRNCETRGPAGATLCGADRLAEKLIGSLGKGGLSKHVLSVDDEQQIVSRLEVNVPGIPRCPGIIKRGFRGSRTSTTQKPCKEHMRDIGIAAVHHELHAVRTPALIAMPNEPHVVRIIRHGKVARPHS